MTGGAPWARPASPWFDRMDDSGRERTMTTLSAVGSALRWTLKAVLTAVKVSFLVLAALVAVLVVVVAGVARQIFFATYPR